VRSANQKRIRFCCSNPNLKAIDRILQLRWGLPLRRTWIEQPYDEEEITLLEEEVLPAIARCLDRIEAIDQALESEQLAQQRVQEEAEQLEAHADALHWEAERSEAGRARMGY